jgi:hypothetical protein
VHVRVRLGPSFSKEVGFSERIVELAAGATAASLLAAIAKAAPNLSCVEGGTVDLGVANLSLNGQAIDPRMPEKVAVREGTEAYLYDIITGG